MSIYANFATGFVAATVLTGGFYMGWPYIEHVVWTLWISLVEWMAIRRNPLLRDPFYRRIEGQILEARRQHKAVSHLYAARRQRARDLLGGE